MAEQASRADQLDVVRAVVASIVADALDATLVPARAGDGSLDGRYYTLVGEGLFGRQLLEELAPLEQLLQQATGDGEQPSADGGLTNATLFLDELMANLHDTVLNPALPFSPTTPLRVDIKPLNEIYGHVLETAEVAGGVTLSESGRAAHELLFTEQGTDTDEYATYKRYEADIAELQDALDSMPSDAADARRERVRRKIDQLEAEWVGVGHRQQIDHAIKVIITESAAGFEDERATARERFESGRRMRTDAVGRSYHQAALSPITPLFDDTQGWVDVVLSSADVRDHLEGAAELRARLGLADATLTRVLPGLEDLSFRWLRCAIRRDWFSDEFVRARYWRTPEQDRLSDGRGAGRMPCLPVEIVFVRDLAFRARDVTVELVAAPRVGRSVTVDRRSVRAPGTATAPPEQRLAAVQRAADAAGLRAAAQMLQARPQRPQRPPSAAGVGAVRPRQASVVAPARLRDHRAAVAPSTDRPSRFEAMRAAIRERTGRVVVVTGRRAERRVEGRVTAPPSVAEALDSMEVRIATTGESGETPRSVDVSRPARGELRFAVDVPASRPSGSGDSEDVLQLLAGDEVVAEYVLPAARKSRRPLRLLWTASAATTEFVLGEGTPIAHGYTLELLPRSPDPDEAMEWP